MTPRIDLTNATADGRLSIAEKVRPLRTAAGLTQTELAEAAAVDRKTISNIERGKGAPQADVLRRILRVLGVATDEDVLEAQTEQWLGIMGALIENIDAPIRAEVVADAILVLANGVKRRANVGGTADDVLAREDLALAAMDRGDIEAEQEDYEQDA